MTKRGNLNTIRIFQRNIDAGRYDIDSSYENGTKVEVINTIAILTNK